MGTNNFLNRNASKIYAVYDPEINDPWVWESFYEGIRRELKEIDYNTFSFKNSPTPSDNNRRFSGRVIGDKGARYVNAEREVELIVCIKAVIRSGYYKGANLDWELEVEKIHRQPLVGQERVWIENAKETLIIELEKLYSQICDKELIKVGQFSNGVAVYEESKDEEE